MPVLRSPAPRGDGDPYNAAAWFLDAGLKRGLIDNVLGAEPERQKWISGQLRAAKELVELVGLQVYRERSERFFVTIESGELTKVDTNVRGLKSVWSKPCIRGVSTAANSQQSAFADSIARRSASRSDNSRIGAPVNGIGDVEAEQIRAYGVALVWRVAGELGLTYEQSMHHLSAEFSRHLRPPTMRRASRGVSRATSFAAAKQAIRSALRDRALASGDLAHRVLAAGVSAGTFKRARFALCESREIEKCGGGGFGPPLTWRLTQADMTPGGAR